MRAASSAISRANCGELRAPAAGGSARARAAVRTEADACEQRAGEVERRDVSRGRLGTAGAILAKLRAGPVRELVDPTCAPRRKRNA